MTLLSSSKWLWLLALASTVLVGCDLEPPPEPVYATVTFEVTVPSDTPVAAAVTVLGSYEALGGGLAPGFLLNRQDAGTYTRDVQIRVGTEVKYELWQKGVWAPEVSAEGATRARRGFLVEEDMTVSVRVERWGPPAPCAPAQRAVAGCVRYHTGVTSRFLSQPRDVIVYLPPGYAEQPERRYPVLYEQHGQWAMDPATSGGRLEWKLDEHAEQLISEGQMEPIIIVGVYSTVDLIAEYTQAPDPQHGGGNADAYGRFLIEELKPMIDARYRTLSGPEDTGLSGAVEGGLVALYLGLRHPETFTRIGMRSASVGWADRDIIKRVQALETRPPLRIWLSVDTVRGSVAGIDDRRLRDALMAKGWGPGDLQYLEVEGSTSGPNLDLKAALTTGMFTHLFPVR